MIRKIGRIKDDRDKIINELIDKVNALSNIRTSGGITARILPGCVSLSGGGAGNSSTSGLRNAFAVSDAGSGATISCYLDTDNSGNTVTVNCEIVGGTALNSAIPRLEDGDRLTVWLDGDTWRCTTIFQATTDC